MNMFATQGGVVELWVTKTDTYTSTWLGAFFAGAFITGYRTGEFF